MNPSVDWDDQLLTVVWPDGHRGEFAAVWLRDNCPEDRDAATGQRLFDIADLRAAEPSIRTVDVRPDAAVILWADTMRQSWFQLQWLRDHCGCGEHAKNRMERRLWTSADAQCFPARDYSTERRADWLDALVKDGIVLLHNVPARHAEVIQVALLLGYVTETNYGRMFDVREIADPNNLAFTSRGLGLHTDNPYRDPVPGFQLLHCLEQSSQGGESIFVDGFAVVEDLSATDPEAVEMLATVPVPFAFRDKSAALEAVRPLIERDPWGDVKAVHYNNRSMRPIRLPAAETRAYYRAYRLFAELLRDPNFEWRIKLEKGDLVAFDNHRILHGRTAFQGSRHLQGCYLARDGVFSNFAMLDGSLAVAAH